jgi:ABC-type Fe3+/spermidine/putrescine transport system ATPase subunit
MTTATTSATTLSARGRKRHYGKGVGLVRAVDGVDLDIERSETVAIMGPSGCGKSTVLHLLSGLDQPTQGEISLHGTRLDTMGSGDSPGCAGVTSGSSFRPFTSSMS